MTVLTFFNHAGGVAKTSSVRDIGYVLAEAGNRVLLVDTDPQANLTRWLGVGSEVDLAQTIYPTVIAADPASAPLPQPLRVHGMDLIPSSIKLAALERELVGIFMGVVRLRDALRATAQYDYILIDPPPSLGQLSALAVVAADQVVVPLPTNRKGLDGLTTVMRMVKEYRRAAPGLRVAMFLLTQHDRRTRHDRESLAVIESQLSEVAPVSSPLNQRPAYYSDAQVEGVPVPVYAPGSEADVEIRRATAELVAAVKGNSGGQA
ncbi:MAG: ParA family protein [Trueperaceae bacterium]|nr:ParA family protein [Trueperaceae bacterium]